VHTPQQKFDDNPDFSKKLFTTSTMSFPVVDFNSLQNKNCSKILELSTNLPKPSN